MTRSEGPAVVIVSHLCPFPTIHGNRSRLVALLRWLRVNGFRVTYILQPLDVDGSSGIRELRDVVDRLEVVPSPHQNAAALAVRRIGSRVARSVLPGAIVDALRSLMARGRRSGPIVKETWGTGDVGGDGHIDRWCWPTTRECVQRVIQRDDPITVITEYALLSKCLEQVQAPIVKVIDTVEVFFRNRERFNVEGLAAPFVCTPESERVALNRADVLIAIQRNDAQALKELFPGKRVITVGHTYGRADWRSRRPENGVVLYVGSSNPFNVHGLRQFLVQAWPRILREVHARLRIVGSCPRMEGLDDRGVVYVGRVSDEGLTREYQRAHVVINPQVAGTGLKIKCVEALSAGCPVVLNRAGADGLEEGGGRAFLLARDWEEFARHVVRTLTDDALRAELEMEAVRLADRMFSPEATFSELAQVLGQGTMPAAPAVEHLDSERS